MVFELDNTPSGDRPLESSGEFLFKGSDRARLPGDIGEVFKAIAPGEHFSTPIERLTRRLTPALDEDVTSPEARAEFAPSRDVRVDVAHTSLGVLPGPEATTDDSDFSAIGLSLGATRAAALAETHEALPASLPPVAVAAEEPLELDLPDAPVARADVSARAATPLPNRHRERTIPTVRTAAPTSASKSQPKTGFFAGLSRMFGKITPPADPKSIQRVLDGTPKAPQRFPKVKPESHSDVLYAETVREGQAKILPVATLTGRLSRANSNDIYAQIKASHPKLKIGFDGQIEGFSPFQRLTFASKLEKDPVLAAAVYELQRRNNHVRAVQGIY